VFEERIAEGEQYGSVGEARQPQIHGDVDGICWTAVDVHEARQPIIAAAQVHRNDR